MDSFLSIILEASYLCDVPRFFFLLTKTTVIGLVVQVKNDIITVSKAVRMMFLMHAQGCHVDKHLFTFVT